MKKKKAQIKIQEMSFMLLALLFFFILAGLFFLIISSGELEKGFEEASKEQAIFLIERLAGSPEFTYGEVDAIDADKLSILKDRSAYEGFWPVESLVIRKVYPRLEGEVECLGGIYTDCNTFTIKSSEEKCWTTPFSSFVAICWTEVRLGYVYDRCEIGRIEACPIAPKE